MKESGKAGRKEQYEEIILAEAAGASLEENVTRKIYYGRKIMQEEVTQKTIALVIRTSKLTADVLKKAMIAYLNHRKHKKSLQHGKISVRKLMGKDQGANTMEITENNIKTFERVAKKYNVDFAVKKDKTVDPPKYVVFFKGRDADVIAMAFKEFVHMNEKKQNRESVRDRLNHYKELWTQNMNRERAREKTKNRGQSL